MLLSQILAILPPVPSMNPNDIAMQGVNFFSLWLARIGGIVAFAGAVKFALGVKDEEAREQMQGIMIMISGFMITSAVNDLGIFNIPATYTAANADIEFKSILDFIGKWVRRAGAAALLIGAIKFGFSVKENDAVKKVSGLKTMASGGLVWSIALMLPTFV